MSDPHPRRPSSTFAKQRALPRLPIPQLDSTIARYLRSLEPFLQQRALRSGTDIAQLRESQRALAADFVAPGGLGQKLQQRLKDIDNVSPFNWLNDSIWPRVAYHGWREPLLIHSNWWLLLQDDPTVPIDVRKASSVEGQTSEWQIRRAAWLVKRFLDFRDMLEDQSLAPDSSRSAAWLRVPALSFYGVTRIALPGCDSLTRSTSTLKPAFVHVMFRERSYRIQVTDRKGVRMPVRDIERSLHAIVRDGEERNEAFLPVGRLTADHRDRWAKNREHLLSLDPINQQSMSHIESALFTLCLDDHALPSDPFQSPPSSSTQPIFASGHIRNTASNTKGTNRWFDKSFCVILESNARFGMMGEHSPVDALIPSIIADWAISEPIDVDAFGSSAEQEEGDKERWEVLEFIGDETLKKECEGAKKRAEEVIRDSDAGVLWFDEYGVKWIKEQAKLSPDAYIQMALQLAWFKSRGVHTATYETASTRLFLHGRTETIRTLSSESVEFVEAMVNPSSSPAHRRRLLEKAITAHNAYTIDASRGKGIDRHFLGLRTQLREGESSPFLDDPVFASSQEWKLSTSGLSAGDRFVGTGFGAMYHDGYGINYLTGAEILKFGIESKRSCPETSTEGFKALIVESLREMREVCNVVNVSL